jgi:DNA mismatch repair protein MutS
MPKAAEKGSATPVMRQYLAAKAAHKDALVFFRMGDFYELFFDDAVVAARALDLTLTSRNKGASDEVPMAGVPHHAASGYVQRLLERGFKVAICEQMADPSKVKGIVPREVVRVVSPGLAYDDTGLVANKNHYLVSVEYDAGQGLYAIAAFDASTGELSACEAPDLSAASSELARLDPREVLAGPGTEKLASELAATRPRTVVRDVSLVPLADAFADETLAASLGRGDPLADEGPEVQARGGQGAIVRGPLGHAARRAAARCLAVAKASDPALKLSVRLVSYALGETLLLDDATQRHLELVRTMDGDEKASLLSHIDETQTAPGGRLLRRRLLAPRTAVAEIRRRLDAVELFVTQARLRAEVRALLSGVSDLERLAVKLTVQRAGPRDLHALRASLRELPAVVTTLERTQDPSLREALDVPSGEPLLDTCADLCQLLERALEDDPPVKLADGGVIRPGFDAELDEARVLARDGQRVMVELEGRMRESSGIASLKVRYTRVFGWYMEVTRTHVDRAPSSWRRKQTIAAGERFTCGELDTLADKLAHAEDRFAVREGTLFAALVRELAAGSERFRRTAERLASWDVAAALAEVAHRDDFARPEVDDSLTLSVEDGRHPTVEKLAAAGHFVPNDVWLDAALQPEDGKGRLWLVTGPNMAGKSTLMRQMAIIVILAQMGSFVPARRARIGVVDRVLTRVGASDNLSKGESTFMVEMKETANVLRRATRRSLVILDEIGRGTSTYDGLAIAWAVAETLHDAIGCRAMFATHYHELTELAATRPGLQNWSVTAREYAGEIVFLHKLARGAASRSYGVACARLAGVPELVLARAKVILDELEGGATRFGTRVSPDGHVGPPIDRQGGGDQLDLFSRGSHSHPALESLRSVDVDRLTPLEALQLVATLKTLAVGS